MKTSSRHTHKWMTTSPTYVTNGCSNASEDDTLRMHLLNGLGLSEDKFSKKVLEILKDKKESVPNKIYSLQSLVRLRSVEGEDYLVRMVSQKDTRLSLAAMKILSFKGTEIAYKALSKTKSLPYKTHERQKDFALLMIGYRLQMGGLDEVLNRLIKAARPTKQGPEFRLGFLTLAPDDISAVLKQSGESHYGILLSYKMAFEIKVDRRTYYFYFNDKFDDTGTWPETLKTKQIFGQVFRKERRPGYISQRYVVLATPTEDHAQLSIFRNNGELFILARLIYDSRKNSLTITNMENKQTSTGVKTELILPQKMSVIMNFSPVRCHKKREAISI